MKDDQIQIEIGNDLYREYYKLMDKFHTLISLIFATAGFTLTVLNLTVGKQVSIQDAITNYHIVLCFLFILFAFIISIINVQKISYHRKIILKDGLMSYREGDELVKNNVKLHCDIIKLKDYYIIAISSIGFSLITLVSYFARHRYTIVLMIIVIFLMLVISIRKSHH